MAAKSFNMPPTWLQNCSQMHPKWLPEASGRPLGAEAGFWVILGSILAPILAPKIVRNGAGSCSKIKHRFWTSFFGPLGAAGGVLGSILEACWHHFWCFSRLRGRALERNPAARKWWNNSFPILLEGCCLFVFLCFFVLPAAPVQARTLKINEIHWKT